MNLDDILHLASQGGALVVLAFFIVAFMKGWIVTSSIHQGVIRDRDDWKEIALTLSGAAREAVTLAERRRIDGARETSQRASRGNP